MKQHEFLFTPKAWLGEGQIQMSMVEDELGYYTRWKMSVADDKGQITATQEVQIQGMSEVMHNQFILTPTSQTEFSIELENAALGTVVGTGIVEEDIIAWEFRDPELGFEGFEFYERQPDGSYMMRAEYTTPDQYRTQVRGKVWEREED